MYNEFLLEVLFIKIKLKGYLENKSNEEKERIEVYAIKNKDKISYMVNNTAYKISKHENKLYLIRDNSEFTHKFIFDIDNITKSEYYIKELNTSIDVLIRTKNLIYNDKKIKIDYEIIDSQLNYSYVLDME